MRPLLKDEHRIRCVVEYWSPRGKRNTTFELSCHSTTGDEARELWRQIEHDVMFWLYDTPASAQDGEGA